LIANKKYELKSFVIFSRCAIVWHETKPRSTCCNSPTKEAAF